MKSTKTVVIMVSRRDGQVTLVASVRTSWRNCKGFVIAAVNHPVEIRPSGRLP
jgi:hypothetical protein